MDELLRERDGSEVARACVETREAQLSRATRDWDVCGDTVDLVANLCTRLTRSLTPIIKCFLTGRRGKWHHGCDALVACSMRLLVLVCKKG